MANRPHSRGKTTGTGSAGVSHGGGVGFGGRVGSGGRPAGGGAPTGGGAPAGGNGGGPVRAGGPKLSLKSILVIAAIVIVGFIILRSCGGSILPNISDIGGDDPGTGSFPIVSNNTVGADTSASYSKPDYSVSSLARAKRVTPVGNGEDKVNVMIYMCGTDLESKHGMATSDLKEMMKATIGDNVNVIVMTGGCNKWQNNEISSSKNQIYRVKTGGLERLEKDFGTAAMTDPANLTKFVKYCSDRYDDATRNFLILWDHGGGTVSGFGYDEKNSSTSSMTLPKIAQALKNAGTKFDFIGFDACLMATLETALVCNDTADYLIASEETEPGTGWYYTNWLTELSGNTSISTVDLAQTIIDDFVGSSCSAQRGAKVTLSLIDLAELEGTVPKTFNKFASATAEVIESGNYKGITDARASVRQFAQDSQINQVDTVDLANRIGSSEAKAFSEALRGCVKYNKTTISNAYGLSIYFPYENTSSMKAVTAAYDSIDMDDEYTDCIKSFASLNLGGSILGGASQLTGGLGNIGGDLLGSLLSSYVSSGSSTSPVAALAGSFLGGGSASSAGSSLDLGSIMSLLGGFSGRSMPEELDWVDTELIADNAKSIAENFLDPERITVTEKDGKQVLELTDEEWELVQTVELNVFARDGEGYVDLGLDNTFEWLDDNSIDLTYDGTWLTLNGNVCSYNLVSDTERADGTWITEGCIPAIHNGEPVNLRVVFDEKNCPEGMVTGAYPQYDDGTDVFAKGEIQIKEGDKIQLVCDYYNLDETFDGSYTLGKQFKVPASGLELVNLKLDVEEVAVSYRITDRFDNHFWLVVD